MIFFHTFPEGEEECHIPDRCCECEPLIDPEDISNFVHTPIKGPAHDYIF